jgi:hypothetical protein
MHMTRGLRTLGYGHWGQSKTPSEDLATWTFETVLELVRRDEYELGRVDFKAVLHATDPKHRKWHQEIILRCVVSMANACGGGYILVGVRDPRTDKDAAVLASEERIVGIPLGGDLR